MIAHKQVHQYKPDQLLMYLDLLFQVRYGVDQNADAVASFNSNVMDYPGSPFNPPGSARAFARHCTVGVVLAWFFTLNPSKLYQASIVSTT